jgi:hypothetical protein
MSLEEFRDRRRTDLSCEIREATIDPSFSSLQILFTESETMRTIVGEGDEETNGQDGGIGRIRALGNFILYRGSSWSPPDSGIEKTHHVETRGV